MVSELIRGYKQIWRVLEGVGTEILKLLNNDAEVHEGSDYIEIHPRHSYNVEPLVRLLEGRGFKLVRRRVFGDPRTTSNYYDYYRNDEGVEVVVFYARDMLVFRVIRDIRVKALGKARDWSWRHYPYYPHPSINQAIQAMETLTPEEKERLLRTIEVDW